MSSSKLTPAQVAAAKKAERDAKALAFARQEWRDVFIRGPYASFKMIKFLLDGQGSSDWGTLVTHPDALKAVTPHVQKLSQDHQAEFAGTWNSGSGRCTSFEVRVTMALTQGHAGVFDWEHHNLRAEGASTGHRVARCKNTGIVIDSSSPDGAFIMTDGKSRVFTNEDGVKSSWEYSSGKSHFIRSSKEVLGPALAGGHHEAMVICHHEIALNAANTCVSIFRDAAPHDKDGNLAQESRYFGAMKWDMSKVKDKTKMIKLVHTIDHTKKWAMEFIWDSRAGQPTKMPTRTPAENEKATLDAINWTVDFVRNHGGPHGVQQWQTDKVKAYHEEIFWAACERYGGAPIMVEKNRPTA